MNSLALVDSNFRSQYRDRWYSPEQGRFLSEDPIGFSSLSENFYNYGDSDPIRMRDPSGWYACMAAPPGGGPPTPDDPPLESIYPEDWISPKGIVKAIIKTSINQTKTKMGRKAAKRIFRKLVKKGTTKIVKDKTGGGAGVAGKTNSNNNIRIRYKKDGTTRIQINDKKYIFTGKDK